MAKKNKVDHFHLLISNKKIDFLTNNYNQIMNNWKRQSDRDTFGRRRV